MRGIDWGRIESFLGFGRRDAAVVFIGMEEGLRDKTSLERDLVRRSTYDDVMDLEEAHRGIAHSERRFDPKRTTSQRTWRPMCDLMLRRGGNPQPDLTQRNEYQATRLGRIDSDTLLMELLPYPHNKLDAWDYTAFGRYQSRRSYYDDQLPKRTALLCALLAECNREIVICYGSGYRSAYKNLFPDAQWNEEAGIRRAKVNGGVVLLTPHFCSRAFNSTQQLAQFAHYALD